MTPELEAVHKFNAWLFSLPHELTLLILFAPAGLVMLIIGWAFDRKVRFDGAGWPFGVHSGIPDPDEAPDDTDWIEAAEDAVDDAVHRHGR